MPIFKIRYLDLALDCTYTDYTVAILAYSCKILFEVVKDAIGG
jgi:hypothetical protein